jgi:hypothetical protein
MNMPNDFFARRLAAIEQGRTRRLTPMEEEIASHAHVNRLGRVIPLVVACIIRKCVQQSFPSAKSLICCVRLQTQWISERDGALSLCAAPVVAPDCKPCSRNAQVALVRRGGMSGSMSAVNIFSFRDALCIR